MDIMKELIAILREYKSEDVEVSENTTFDELEFDSLDKVELLMNVEEKFGFQFDDDLTVTTLGELAEIIKGKIA